MNGDSQPTKNDPVLVLKIIWGLLLASQGLYVFIVSTMIQADGDQIVLQSPEALVRTMMVLAVLSTTIGIFLPRFLAKNTVAPLVGNGRGIDSLQISELVPRMIAPLIIRFAFFEASCLFGFVSTLQSRTLTTFVPFLALSVPAMLLNFPSEQKIRDLGR